MSVAASQWQVAAPVAEVADPRRDPKALLTQQLRMVLEQRAVRFAVVAVMLLASSLLVLFPAPMGIDYGWVFIVPVAMSAIAAGLGEGLLAAFVAAALCGVYGGVSDGFDGAMMLGVISSRFALYGITAGFLGAFAEAHHSVQMNLHHLATTDPLTRVANISSFYSFVNTIERERSPFALVVIDMDDLKKLNDTHGHQVGSAAIQTVARVLSRVVRTSDLVARFGGDEFVMVLREADASGAQIVVNRVRTMLADEVVPGTGGVSVTISAGAALYGRDGTTVDELIAAADASMYSDKRNHKAEAVRL
ncbi:MAG: GGDEF domain-containing protein [Actinomycetota bacterium]|nr:GGDEF domain-containing protein [Actinomycetota bacterium]